MKSICIVSSRYPTSITPSEHVFVKQLVWELADLGINCTVISPLSVNQNPNFYKVPVVSEEKTNKGSIVNLRFPRYISFGQKKLGNRNTVHFTTSVFHKTVLKEIKKLKITPDVVYGHFLAPSGVTVSRITKELSIPSFVAFGESTPWSIHNYGLDKIKNELKHVSGVISVSTENKKILGELNVFPEDIINVFPNGVRNDHYYQRDKKLSREKMGFKEQDFIVAFVGRFNERKGALRVLKAVNDLDEIKVAFAGDGDDKSKLVGNKVIYNDRVTPELMPYFLSAADVFVYQHLMKVVVMQLLRRCLVVYQLFLRIYHAMRIF